jgi:hypothetical protein
MARVVATEMKGLGVQIYNQAYMQHLNTFKPEPHLNNISNAVLTAKKTQRVNITTINWLTLFKEIIAVYSESHMKPMNTLCGQTAEL